MARRGVSRRDVLRAGAAATGTAIGGAVPLRAFALPPDGPRALTREQYALLDELTEILIPADERSGGARAAGAAAYIDGRLAEAFDRDEVRRFVDGLRLVDAIARRRAGRRFLDLDPAAREAVVAWMARDEERPETPEGTFFVDLKRRTVHAYYTSRIGIHDEMGYLGNTMQEEYSGIDVSPK